VPWVGRNFSANGLQGCFRDVDSKGLAGRHKVVANL
jgi:hypothetical protein